MRLIDYDGFTMDPLAVNLVAKVGYVRDKGHGFIIIVNGSPILIGVAPQKVESDSKRDEFIELLRTSLAELDQMAVEL